MVHNADWKQRSVSSILSVPAVLRLFDAVASRQHHAHPYSYYEQDCNRYYHGFPP